jgi:hypothetical protein
MTLSKLSLQRSLLRLKPSLDYPLLEEQGKLQLD